MAGGRRAGGDRSLNVRAQSVCRCSGFCHFIFFVIVVVVDGTVGDVL